MKQNLDHKFMRMAIGEARKNLRNIAGGPFGACLVKGSRVLAVCRNKVLKKDASCHAEINAIKEASLKLKTYDLSGCQIYSTTEPCPMCFSAIHWAKMDAIIYGTKITDVKKLGFNELCISNRKMKALGKSNVKIVSGFLVDECINLLKGWGNLETKMVY